MDNKAAQAGVSSGMSEGIEHEVFRGYLSRSDKVVFLLDEALKIRVANGYGCSIVGREEKELVGRAFLEELVDVDRLEELREELMHTGFAEKGTPLHNIFRLRNKDGTLSNRISWQHFGVRDEETGKRRVLSVGEDVEDQLVTSEVLERRNAILEALTVAADRFLLATPEVWEKNLIEVLEAMANARGSDRVYVCKNREMEEGKTGVSLKYEWKRQGESKAFEGEAADVYNYGAVGLGRWAEVFSRREVMCDEVFNLREEERQWNVAPEAKSLVLIPIHIDDEWWGYWGFEDWGEVKHCQPAEIEALKALALLFGAAVKRKRVEEELQAEKTSVEHKVQERTQELTEAQDRVEDSLVIQKEEKAKLTASIHSLSMGFVMTGLEGEVKMFNHMVNEIFGHGEQNWTLDMIQKELGPEANLPHLVGEAVREVKEITLDDVVYKERVLNIRLTPIKMIEGDGRVIGVVILFDDVTEDRKLQQARDEFFAVTAHELRTPLTAINGMAQMILHYYPDAVKVPDVNQMITDIHKSSSSLIAMINEYLDVSLAELNKIQVQRETVDVVAVAKGVVEELKQTAHDKGLEMAVQTDNETGWVQADKARTRQVLTNLVGNAIKYTDKGGVYVKVVRSNNGVEVRVVDTGVGIKEEDQGRLFKKFERVGDRVYEQQGVATSSGMGLYISKLLAEAMGGEVCLNKSELGKGSEFVFKLNSE